MMEVGLGWRAQAEGGVPLRAPCVHHVAPMVSVAMLLAIVAAGALQHRRVEVLVHGVRRAKVEMAGRR
jgi:hypothetical protein